MILILTYYVKEKVNISESCSYKGITTKKSQQKQTNKPNRIETQNPVWRDVCGQHQKPHLSSVSHFTTFK